VLVVLVLFFIAWGYFLAFEALNDGRTPGKRLLGIRVVMDTGHRVTVTAAAVRNLVRVVDAQPLVSYLVGFGFVLFHPQNKRLGTCCSAACMPWSSPSVAVASPPGARTAWAARRSRPSGS